MSPKRPDSIVGAMLELWRPPRGAGDPFGCLSSTYTFDPQLFDEECLARFLDIDSAPDREDLAYLLERETRLGSVYAGVLVDHSQAGVEHSLRWDVLPVRIRQGIQHAKLSLLVWARHIRLIVASANLTEPGYRTNQEVALAIDLSPEAANLDLLGEGLDFFQSLLQIVQGSPDLPAIARAEDFLTLVVRQSRSWIPDRRRGTTHRHLVCTLPATRAGGPRRSSLDEAVDACRRRGPSPAEVRIASPFFDTSHEVDKATAALGKVMARGSQKEIVFCVPQIGDEEEGVPRLAAPRTLLTTAKSFQASVTVQMLPLNDDQGNPRPWHAKMIALVGDSYSALMIGSTNFTCAGLGVATARNAEANLLTILGGGASASDLRGLESLWPEMEVVLVPEEAEWIGPQPDQDEEGTTDQPRLPEGFVSATYHAGADQRIVLQLDPKHLPGHWSIRSCGTNAEEIVSHEGWKRSGGPATVKVAWPAAIPPEKLLVQWEGKEAFLPLNIADPDALPPPPELHEMSADNLLLILASADPSGAFRALARRLKPEDSDDSSLDSAAPIDLDPLRRFDLRATFLHRVRRRARILAQVRANLERPLYSTQSLQWRLHGLLGVKVLAEKYLREFATRADNRGEALLTLADLLIVLTEVTYQSTAGAIGKSAFAASYRPFLREMAASLDLSVQNHSNGVSHDTLAFWASVVALCQE